MEVTPVKTQYHGLCYKLQLLKPLPDPPYSLGLGIRTFGKDRDRLKKVNVLIASNNTWQGIITNNWPYKAPPLIGGKFVPDKYNMVDIRLKENLKKFRRGYDDFNQCMKDKDNKKCVSIFDLTINESQNG